MTDKSEALAAIFLDARRTGEPIPALVPGLVPASAEEAYAVQDQVARRLGAIAGWKVGAPGPTAEPNCAPLFADTVAPSPARFPSRHYRLRGIEAELAFRFGKALPPRAASYDDDEVSAAIGSLHPAIEVVETRFSDLKSTAKFALLADNQANGAFCYGPAGRDWRSVDFLSQEAILMIDGKEVARAKGGNAAGHPLRLLVWLANQCARRGGGLKAGDIVTTGTHTGLIAAPPHSTVIARFPGIGEATLGFTA